MYKHKLCQYLIGRQQLTEVLQILNLTQMAQAAIRSLAAPVEPGTLPRIPFGKYSLSRLVCGANPFNAGSHLSTFVNEKMRRYYTPEQVLKTLRRCEAVGINGWQSSGKDCELNNRRWPPCPDRWFAYSWARRRNKNRAGARRAIGSVAPVRPSNRLPA